MRCRGSWILDGCARLNPVLYVSTGISIVMTVALLGIFISYLTEYIKERRTVSSVPCIVNWVFVGVAVVLTVAACFSGKIFTIENGVYSDGVLYPLYVVANAGALIIGVVIIFLYRKALDLHDRLIAYTYMAIPIISAGINLFVEEWAYTYAAITLSLLVINVMIQSDRAERLANEGVIVSYHATHDELTGLFNSRAFHDRVEILKDRDGESGVIFGDLNGLKYTNDNFGHEAGDRLLIRYAEIHMEIFRMNEIYRISGDEFICMMENVPEEVFMHRLSELKKRLAEDEQPLACIGAQFGSNKDIETLLKSAETEMYAEKEIIHERFPNLKR